MDEAQSDGQLHCSWDKSGCQGSNLFCLVQIHTIKNRVKNSALELLNRGIFVQRALRQ